MSRSLVLVWLAVLGVLGWGLLQRRVPSTYEGALDALLDADPDHDERMRLLEVLVRRGAEPGALERQLVAAVASLELGDATALRRLLREAPVELPAAGPALERASLGETYLRNFLLGCGAAAAGEPARAAELLGQARQSAQLHASPAVALLATEELERLGVRPP